LCYDKNKKGMRMIRRVTVNGREYEVDTTPENGGIFAQVLGVSYQETSGVVAGALRELGMQPVTTLYDEISNAEREQVVRALGRYFSRSVAWRRLYRFCVSW
jgi:hypothetical protein